MVSSALLSVLRVRLIFGPTERVTWDTAQQADAKKLNSKTNEPVLKDGKAMCLLDWPWLFALGRMQSHRELKLLCLLPTTCDRG